MDYELYKIECSRLWRHIDSKLGFSELYFYFIQNLEETYTNIEKTQTQTGWGSPSQSADENFHEKNEKSKKNSKVDMPTVNLASSDDEIEIIGDQTPFECFGQISNKIPNRKLKKMKKRKIEIGSDVISDVIEID